MELLTFTCIGRNEKKHLEQLLPRLLNSGFPVVYVDCESEDESFEYAESLGCKCFRRKNDMNLNVNKSFAMEKASTPWIFYVDPDERISEKLLGEVKLVIAEGSNAAYRLQRKNHYFGQWLRYGGQFPDTQLRCFQKSKGKFPNKHVHESLVIDGSIGKLKEPMEHHPYLTISQFFKKFDFYSSFEAQFLYDQGVRPSWGTAFKFLIWKPQTRFFRRYILKGGFRDGVPGFVAAVGDAWGLMVRYCKLWEIHKNQN